MTGNLPLYMSEEPNRCEDFMRGRTAWMALGGIGLAFVLILLIKANPDALNNQGSQIDLVYTVTLLVLVASSVFAGQRSDASTAIKYAIIWAGIFVGIIGLYSFRTEFAILGERVVGELTPSKPRSNGDGTVTLYRSQGDHFVADGRINGQAVRFLIDTGASDIALPIDVAERIGIDTRRLTFNRPYSTANGLTLGASIRLQKVTIGDITLYDVEASVMQKGSDMTLLGMSFLGRLKGYEVSGNKMTLRN
ncbi:MAG: TIGR02281 family clan AA aspartic protease [Alphaproteobacteria bacterium]|nr:MAG: TIGR02281 family clan AA aspartic protease [Alphaproteobacteria bacterium]